ncbi:electron transfer flavoprotein beta subunit [Actinobaculum suis]|uniref:Electron transfer flavoprotein small subunit n=1 Tax=Actinobaculum suis TaxID=1657 RepID=A0A0K9EUV0_9ACTO|nr:hypothetical protein [Actinobaculum suis]KMY23964.1 hypothetical protein ACU19_01210 [Actinobaculum suis]MDY5153419.1 electron transfer flavoprotein beta subunit/FixA family protein [Actinobaculum suis]OCA93388.1 hypothetical protein ACU20_00790 [Actinobaculum suis]OCA94309.1 hypothetical protein ACU21_00840 [Actinobaculum suis]SDE17584.1 electron transfer flavoprotein beta subunit [Actinobaculum suis]
MTIAVAYKVARNPEAARVTESGDMDWSRARPVISDDDVVAMQVAADLAAQLGTESLGITVGSSIAASGAIRKSALSNGPDRALIVADDATEKWTATTMGQALATLVKREGDITLLLTGPGSIDEGGRVIPGIAAAHLGWPCFQDVTKIELRENGTFRCLQQVGAELRRIDLCGPAVIAVTSDAAEVSVPSMRDIIGAGKKPYAEVSVAELGLSPITASPLARRKAAEKQRKHIIFSGQEAPAQLAAALRDAGFIGGNK